MGNDADHAGRCGDRDIPTYEVFPHGITISVRPGDLTPIVAWCREAWPDQEDVTWGWDFAHRATRVPRDLISSALSGWTLVDYRFWFDRPDDALWFRMVWL